MFSQISFPKEPISIIGQNEEKQKTFNDEILNESYSIRINENRYTSFLEVTIHEGKNREIRKMFKAVGFNVIKLHRIKEATIQLGDLKSGEYRRLKPFELKKLNAYLDHRDL